ncbi:sigma-70 family RNA polymerase sigma factor [Lactobacillus crispatus]|uniref:sigma-70 family RNA polymerase sigma factor n=1 Tax=Lactobacillus crispatus TaxID=47770 RepID=UPI0018AC34D9|nr:sigma-70 family RNA polymerase sigma factor [Lactobacillus crispatus]
MIIIIDKNFTIQVPNLTDYLKDLRYLYKINFGMFKFSKKDYEALNRRIVLSKNTDWNKAIALTILNYKFVTKIIFTKVSRKEYPYYGYPYIYLQRKITYIIESLAMHSMKALIENVKSDNSYSVVTFIGNTMLYSRSLERDHLIGTSSQINGIPIARQKRDQIQAWIDTVIKYKRLYYKTKNYEELLADVREKIANNDQLRKELRKKIRQYTTKLRILEALTPSFSFLNNSSKRDTEVLFNLLLTLQPIEIKVILKHFSSHDRYNLIRMLKVRINMLKREYKLSELTSLKKQAALLEYIINNAPSKNDFSYVFMEKLELLEPIELVDLLEHNFYFNSAFLKKKEDSEFKDDLDKFLADNLTNREENVIRLRYLDSVKLFNKKPGEYLRGGYYHTLKEIGCIFGVDASRIRQIEAKAMRKLRKAAEINKLKQDFIKVHDEIGTYDEHNKLPMHW